MPQPALTPGVAPTHVQDPALGLVELLNYISACLSTLAPCCDFLAPGTAGPRSTGEDHHESKLTDEKDV